MPFPRPYVNDVKMDNSIMEYVPMTTTDIGARKSGMPGNANSPIMGLDHVENRKTK